MPALPGALVHSAAQRKSPPCRSSHVDLEKMRAPLLFFLIRRTSIFRTIDCGLTACRTALLTMINKQPQSVLSPMVLAMSTPPATHEKRYSWSCTFRHSRGGTVPASFQIFRLHTPCIAVLFASRNIQSHSPVVTVRFNYNLCPIK